MSEGTSAAFALRFSAEEPYFAGHFPGNPLVPGVVILDHVITAIERHFGAARSPVRIDSVKFLWPLRPGDELTIELEPTAGTQVRFTCRCGKRAVAMGLTTLGGRAD
jgi:3-hydroxymyristoyl/3-hydroxydecanoyl-(acyl carrier protein) dehydratase